MKTNSSTQFPKTARWKEGETVIYVNHKDNGVQPEGEEGKRYEADFTIVKDTEDITGVIDAFTRMTVDPVQDQLVVDNIEIDGVKAIDAKKDYTTKVSTTIFPPLPSSGALKKGEVYSYNNGAVMVVQDHNRTIYTPEQTPALFSFYRDNTTDLEWMEGEKVEVGWTRMYEGKKYECLQAHQTQSDWTPTATLGVLWKEVPQQSEEYAVFAHPTGAHDVYMKDDIVWYPTLNSTLYRSKIDNNSWSPDEYANGWEIYVP